MNISRKIETTANLATIVVAVLITTVLVRTYVFPNVVARTATAARAPEVAKGKSMDGHALNVDWAKNHRTLLLAISTTCHFCKDSIPFYRKLGAVGTDVKMVAVLPQPAAEAEQYLSGESVHVDEVRQVPLNTLGVRGNDGISQPEELHTLSSLGVVSISLHDTLSRKVDRYGNVFRYKAAVDPNDPDATHVGRTAYDVFFVTLNSSNAP